MNLKHSRNRNRTARRNAFPPGLREGEQCGVRKVWAPEEIIWHSPSIHLYHLHSAPVLNRITSDVLCETLRRRDCLVNHESQTLTEQKQDCETKCVSFRTARGRTMPESLGHRRKLSGRKLLARRN
ncbi:hypothetical protein CEXT_452721 [Caerostris extrusa]|uniref:Uncharacterized protein n=1 Tax=Caerostris extrusa TaxID=172846 RepID=A0AAV4RGX9_CAEEX|nr:hypothetical protein CEXT_452721 [Caerostris extrusa]